MATTVRQEAPDSAADAAALLAEGGRVRIAGRGTRAGWGNVPGDPDLVLRTDAMSEVVEHNAGDLTAVLEAGVPLAQGQRAFAAEGQMLALDPPEDPAGSIGGLFATADGGPLRHRYGAPRDLIVGITVALADGTVAKAGGRVIKNVAGYDLAKLFTGAFGTLGLIVTVAVRLHPRPPEAVTVRARAGDPAALARAAGAAAHHPLEADALDVAWADGTGEVLVRLSGATAASRAHATAQLLELDAEVVEDDDALWAAQRARQRGELVVKVSALATELPRVLGAAAAQGGTVAGRAALGLSWVGLPADDGAARVERLRQALSGARCVVLDAPEDVRAALDPWDAREDPTRVLMRRVKARFDPGDVCNPGLFLVP